MNPLRTIIRTEHDEHGLIYEVLECGHRQRPKQDIYGVTNAYRRRCKACAKATKNGS